MLAAALIGGGMGLLGSLFGASAANKQAAAAERMHQAQVAAAKRWENKMMPYMNLNDRMIYNPETTGLYNNMMGSAENTSNQTLKQLSSYYGGRGYDGGVESGAIAESMGNANRDIFNNAAMSITGAQENAKNQNMSIAQSLAQMYAGMGHSAGMNSAALAGGSDAMWSNLFSGAGGGMMNYAFSQMADTDRFKQMDTLLGRYGNGGVQNNNLSVDTKISPLHYATTPANNLFGVDSMNSFNNSPAMRPFSSLWSLYHQQGGR
jgi:hypothetical protein